MILTVTPNPAIDMTYHVDRFRAGHSLRVPTARSRAGGKGINVARVAAQLGFDTHVVATSGGATGRELDDDLRASGLPHSLVTVQGATRRSVAIVDASDGRTTIMNEHGAPLTETEACELRQCATERMGDASCVVGSGSLPPGAGDAFYADLVEQASHRGLPTIVDATGAALLAAVDAGATLVKPNREELAQTTGCDDALDGARRLCERGARIVLVSLGADGMIALSTDALDEPLLARLPESLAGNPTGAGDAAVAAAAACLVAGEEDPATILRRATAWSAAAVLRPIAGEIADNYSELEKSISFTRPIRT